MALTELRLPIAFFGGQAIVYDNKLYIWNNVKNGSEYTAKKYYFDGNADKGWTEVTDSNFLPLSTDYATTTYRYHCGQNGGCVVHNNQIHIFGGVDGDQQYSIFNGTSWTNGPTLPYSLVGGKAVVYNNNIYILGSSFSGQGKSFYKLNGSSWQKLADLPVNFSNSVAIVYKNAIHIVGRDSSSSIASIQKRYHYAWNGSSWTKLADIPDTGDDAAVSLSGVVYNNLMYVIGFTSKKTIPNCYTWDGSSWGHGTKTREQYCKSGALVEYNNTMYFMGGSGGTNDENNKFWYFDTTVAPYGGWKPVTSGEIEITYTYTSLNNGKHQKITYEDGVQKSSEQESCVYQNGICKYCGYVRPTTIKYVSNNNGTHQVRTIDTNNNVILSTTTSNCNYVNGVCKNCGYTQPTTIVYASNNDSTHRKITKDANTSAVLNTVTENCTFSPSTGKCYHCNYERTILITYEKFDKFYHRKRYADANSPTVFIDTDYETHDYDEFGICSKCEETQLHTLTYEFNNDNTHKVVCDIPVCLFNHNIASQPCTFDNNNNCTKCGGHKVYAPVVRPKKIIALVKNFNHYHDKFKDKFATGDDSFTKQAEAYIDEVIINPKTEIPSSDIDDLF